MSGMNTATSQEKPADSIASRVPTPREENRHDSKRQWQDDDSSLFSDASTGSIFSSDDEDDAPSSLKEFENEFKSRDELLDRLTKGIDPSFARIMRENELAARKEKMLLFKSTVKITDENSHSLTSSEGNCKETRDATSSQTSSSEENCDESHDAHSSQALSFYTAKKLQAVMILLLSSVAYNGFEQIISSFDNLASASEGFKGTSILFLLSVVALCVTGGIWNYANDDIYRIVKFDMKNRYILRKWDAVVAQWFRQHEVVAQSIVNPLAFFACVYVVQIWQEGVMSWAFDIRYRLLQELPSMKYGVMTDAARKLAAHLGEEPIIGHDTESCNLNKLLEDLKGQDEAFLASKISADCYDDLMGDGSSAVVTETVLFWYFAASAVVAIVTLRMMGHKFWSV